MYNCGSRFIQFHACKMDTIVGDEHFFSPCRPVHYSLLKCVTQFSMEERRRRREKKVVPLS